MDVVARHNVTERGVPDGRPMLFAHGFGCDQHMWRFVAPAFEDRFRVVLFDHVGSGGADPAGHDPERHGSLAGYAQDVLDVCRALDLHDVVFVGHSVSAMMGALAAIEEPERFSHLVMVSPSPRYTDDGDYVGGSRRPTSRTCWSRSTATTWGGRRRWRRWSWATPTGPSLGAEPTASFCRADPAVARRFARVTFTSDNRADLPWCAPPPWCCSAPTT
ncbi:hypothetical protein GCM10025868_00810 [Angustibacter aerolatus]|uniref:AB hydrolase-1 domain-containing protein n=1 Tax=Angustibacter aerolatus TaxID=1162965 RepID=A0ABQ6JDH6_9ACTN|nr:alpha/beta fold hydrolase [Angustibacter aerolatus]GMA84831.1 hypothetical protein GCM10025868_00810 [Angustibacter aerolatus]